MMSESGAPSRKRTGRNSDVEAASRFVEELSWLLAAHSDLDFRALRRLRPPREDRRAPELFQQHEARNPNVVYLIGTLPGLFMDDALFPSNEDIADFSATALNISIPRWQKKAKFELVGHIVCHAVSLNDKQVKNLVDALRIIVDGEAEARQIVRAQKQQGLSWNEVIQNLITLNK